MSRFFKVCTIFFLSLFFKSEQIHAQKKVSGVSIESTIKLNNNELILNGVGIREKFWIDLYVGALYLTQKTTDGSTIINNNKPAIITLDIVSSMITSEKMIDAVNDGFKKSLKGKLDQMKDNIETFKSFFMEKIKKGDQFKLIYLPSSGVSVYKNNQLKGSISGIEFKKALFGIWLSDDPADDDLKEAMLGLED